MASLAEIRARLAAAENRGSNNSSNRGGNALYPHWNILEGQTATVRFLPDDNSKNPFFWVEQLTIRLPFAGIKGQSSNQVVVTVPCVEMWNDVCPVLTEVRAWYKDDSLKEMANKYWKKRQYHFQGFVRENPMAEEQPPENPIRRFAMTPQLFNVIKAALMDPELDELPTDYEHGLDFRITKTQKGQYADYNTSSWARRESALTDFERKAIETHGLFDLSSFLPKRPSAEEVAVIQSMFEASVDGRAWDPDLWADYFRPFGFQTDSNNQSSTSRAEPAVETQPAPAKTEAVTEAEADAPWKEPDVSEERVIAPKAEPTAAPAAKAEDILAQIRARQAKS